MLLIKFVFLHVDNCRLFTLLQFSHFTLYIWHCVLPSLRVCSYVISTSVNLFHSSHIFLKISHSVYFSFMLRFQDLTLLVWSCMIHLRMKKLTATFCIYKGHYTIMEWGEKQEKEIKKGTNDILRKLMF